MYTIRGNEETPKQQEETKFLSSPILRNIPEATQNQYITFQGTAPDTNGTIEIYLNNEVADEIEIKKNPDFEIKDLLVKAGENTIKARFVQDKNTSPFSSEKIVSYIKDEPKLEVSFPNDNATFVKADKSITITGKTDVDNTITINGFRAIVDSNGEFAYQYQLNDGENTLDIEATNLAGTSVKKSLKVTYNP